MALTPRWLSMVSQLFLDEAVFASEYSKASESAQLQHIKDSSEEENVKRRKLVDVLTRA
jgi:hypothetical protein